MKRIFNLLFTTTTFFGTIPNLLGNNSNEIQEQITIWLEMDETERNQLLNHSIDDLEITQRTQICLEKAKIYRLSDLVSKTENEIKNIKNLGEKSLTEIKEKMHELGLHFRH
ncbi:DNA-directed RNA polymerase subunit alpha C-terminal domain-containing protein [Spiroplasma melliferum]|uniref:DNA-directed RNA polymerase subunit alpha n=2 Tax=Spiroplasma melliferum TaxID=2134 RepID=A0AAI9T325_SPIME|nr:DNA-directed RNA polymerase subunit alpha C-terminal domain-containing protein [Spiroplasma melliferum]ELL44455.1 DNA-directed RNA polymerase subunit alpha [Spiroplasma melliferum IPMB4A]KAI92384.1 DNA-directed RNA polymerase subunit alpha [Spiroplasma melliferum KC3]QCO23412.1 DNA-directed RNA polymerase subunit alpha [Spiroplasma melliferum]